MEKHFQHRVEDFYTTQSRIFKCFALWELPKNASHVFRIAHKIYFWHIIIFWALLFDTTLFFQFVGNIGSMDEVIKVFFIFATAISVLGKLITIKRGNYKYTYICRIMHIKDMLPVNEREAAIYERTLALSRHVRNSYTFLSLIALNSVLLTQYILDSSELPLSAYIPFSIENKWRYRLVYLYQYISVSICCLNNIAFDSLSASFFIYLKGQLDILSDRMKHMGHDRNDTQEFIGHQLRDCILSYMRVLKMSESIESLVSIPISVQIACSVLVLIANFYAMTFLIEPGEYANFIKFIVYQLCMLTQIFILCYFANELSIKSSELSYALYSCEWSHFSKANRHQMLLMMGLFDNPIRIRAINRCYSFNLTAFTSIVNSSYSYFALLKKMNS